MEWHWQSWISKHSFQRVGEQARAAEKGRTGKKGRCHFRSGNFWRARQGLDKGNVAGLCIRVGLTGSAALGTGSNAVPESAAHWLTLCTCLVPHKDAPCRPSFTPPSLYRRLKSVREESIYNVCFITSPWQCSSGLETFVMNLLCRPPPPPSFSSMCTGFLGSGAPHAHVSVRMSSQQYWERR